MIFVWIFLVVSLLLVVLLAPVLWCSVDADETGGAGEVRWLFVTVGFDTRKREFRLALFSIGVLRRGFEEEKKEEKKPKPEKKKRPPKRRFAPIRLLAERGSILELLRYLWRRLRWERFEVDLTVATPDPALTGTLYGVASATAAMFKPSAGWLHITPDFTREQPSGRFRLALGVRILVLVVFGFRAMLLGRRLTKPISSP
ncbi:MAG: DUF2953 domain-containing protein [Trueperaceae bacterium]|nr:MAG: DUF2953 domain-containing protein [Trueperaceae bacterium]